MHFRTSGLVAAIAVGFMTSGCATVEYVDEQVAAVNNRVAAVEGRVSTLDGRITQVEGRLGTVETTANQALQKADEALKGKLAYSVISESDSVTFDTGRWQLSDEAQATLTAFAERLKGENRGVYIEIVGHADNRGGPDYNRILGEKRALEVRRFLSSQGIPLSHMETVSWGEDQPANPDDLAANRRVVLRVLG